jgi:hypothetical protein
LFQPLGNMFAGTPATVPCVYVGRAPSTPLSHKEKKAIEAQAYAYNARMREPGQHQGPLTAATLRCLHALLWTFHNTEHGTCMPSLRKLAAAARCCKDTAHQAVKALRGAGFLRWWHQFARKTLRGLAGLYRTTNAYTFRQVSAVSAETRCTENPDTRTGAVSKKDKALANARIGLREKGGAPASNNPLEAALSRLMALKPSG